MADDNFDMDVDHVNGDAAEHEAGDIEVVEGRTTPMAAVKV